MRRDYFELEVTNIDWVGNDGEPKQPLVEIEFSGPGDLLRERLSDGDGATLDGKDVDVAFRLQGDLKEDDAVPGVVAVTNRITGDFVLELNETADDVLRFIEAARAYGDVVEHGSTGGEGRSPSGGEEHNSSGNQTPAASGDNQASPDNAVENGGYRVVVSIDGQTLVDYQKNTLLVYDADGEFLREESLIPPGVEL